MDELTLSLVPDGKRCARCGVVKALDEFESDASRPHGVGFRCRECKRWARRESKYGITRDEFERKLAAQGHACAVCGTTEPRTRAGRRDGKPKLRDDGWHVDHDHATGAVRGIVCQRCNVALGHIEGDGRLAQLSDYLRKRSTW